MHVGNFIERNGRLFSQKTAVSCSGECLSYGRLLERVCRLRNALASLGLKRGARIAFLGQNSLAYVEFHIGVSMGGLVAVPLNFRLAPRELAFILNDASCEAIIYAAPFAEAIEQLRKEVASLRHFISLPGSRGRDLGYEDLLSSARAETEAEPEEQSPSHILYTSGTTGFPKGAVLSHRNMLAAIRINVIEEQIVAENRFLGVGPLFHVAPLHILLAFLYRGCSCTIVRQFDPKKVLETIQKERITNLFLVPAMLKAVLDFPELARYDLSSLSTIAYGGSPTPKDLLLRGLKTLGPIFLQVYGSTETGLTSVLYKGDHMIMDSKGEHKYIHTCGRGVVDFLVRTVDESGTDTAPGKAGEIVVRGESVMQGYWGRPEETEKAFIHGWFCTGDVGTLDDEGYLSILDRKKDVIISGGENIYPAEIESLLSLLPQVSESAVIGVPDERWGETVKAVIVLKKGESLSSAEVTEFCKRNLASYKKPTTVDFVEELPKNSTGKTLKRILREHFAKGAKGVTKGGPLAEDIENT
ncbi:MAG: long-chain-fatty-acid--CoA ligase [Deltaproteobacteria bacterium]|nr:long-chain-fatty-acid--CoA ligase [Deltaproteobacteria bacterium]